jgi:uncharacterized protein (TIGR02271 family)
VSRPVQEETIIGTFADAEIADRAAEAARKSGFQVERRSGGVVAVETGGHAAHADEIRGILGAYGAREYSASGASGGRADTSAAEAGHAGQVSAATAGHDGQVGAAAASYDRQVVAEQGAKVELLEEELHARTRPVQTGEVTIRREVISETRTIEVPVRREELVIERHPVERRPMDRSPETAADPLVEQIIDRLRHMQPGEMLRIPIVEEEVVVHKRPVVVEEITLGKRSVEETQKVTDTVRREVAHIDEHGAARIHRSGD